MGLLGQFNGIFRRVFFTIRDILDSENIVQQFGQLKNVLLDLNISKHEKHINFSHSEHIIGEFAK